jgi:hypothetical protein
VVSEIWEGICCEKDKRKATNFLFQHTLMHMASLTPKFSPPSPGFSFFLLPIINTVALARACWQLLAPLSSCLLLEVHLNHPTCCLKCICIRVFKCAPATCRTSAGMRCMYVWNMYVAVLRACIHASTHVRY